jgi:4-hydroxymandelate oxidase
MATTHSNPLSSDIPPEVRHAQDYEVLAPRYLDASVYAYIAGGSGNDITVAANRTAFAQLAIVPRLLRDVHAGHTRLTLAGLACAHPLWLAPVAHQKLAHEHAELESARAAQAMEAGMIVSTLSSATLEEIARIAGPQRWFQLYFQPQREVTLSLVHRAHQAGFGAIVVTLDAAIQLPSRRALEAGFRLPAECVAANLQEYPVASPHVLTTNDSRIFQGVMRDAPRWRDLDWLIRQSPLPVWVKGVLHADDAHELQQRGVAGIVVSNHGGRSLDGAPASLDMLPAIRAAVSAEYPLLLDSGIRSGSDVFKAIALGADAVLIGRLQMYALAVAGALGVAHMLKLLREELEACMAHSGCASLADVRRATLVRVNNKGHEGFSC